MKSKIKASLEMVYADLILPLPLTGVFTYFVPEELHREVSPGKRVVVQFGRKKIYSAIIKKLHNKVPGEYKTKAILSVLDQDPLISPLQLEFWEWISYYYMCSEGEVLKAAMPAGLKPAGEPGLSSRTKGEAYISLHPSVINEKKLNELTARLGKAPRQQEILMNYLGISEYSGFNGPAPEIPAKSLPGIPKDNYGPLRALFDKKILLETRHPVSRLMPAAQEQKALSDLNPWQAGALENIRELFEKREVVLLKGITSGGKTEIYIHLIKEELAKGKQVLYLLPEIALTAQIIVRLKSIFGEKAGVYHSRFSDSERVEIWSRVLVRNDESYSLILGARSSLFLPFSGLGLVIVDEEHENSYKQFDPAPRYHARDAAIMLASMHGAKTLLGTATPSVESYFNALSGKYGLVNLTKRYQEIELPRIAVADTREARKRKKMRSLFTPQLLGAIEEALGNGEQVILFQNRRGYAPFIECSDCGWIPRCEHCDVSMTYHKGMQQLICHYCGSSARPRAGCLDCGSPDVRTRGFGTEKIEDEISLFFPGVRVGRLDLDSVRKKRAHEKIIGEFESRNLDILVGTQMIAKGLDFSGVSLVGILNADNLLFFPDFRAHERSFQLIVQVSGRAGRKTKQGNVIIQTGFPAHPVIKNIVANDFETNFKQQITERKQFLYPPYVRLFRIILKDKKKEVVEKAASGLADSLRRRLGSRVLGPEYPVIGRIQNRYIMNILLKIEKEIPLSGIRTLIHGEITRAQAQPGFRSCIMIPDVDPL